MVISIVPVGRSEMENFRLAAENVWWGGGGGGQLSSCPHPRQLRQWYAPRDACVRMKESGHLIIFFGTPIAFLESVLKSARP